jgi:pimeloyl-ACP methyl ester carboxylesterase
MFRPPEASARYGAAALVLALLSPFGPAQEATAWRDPSPHQVRFVTGQEGVRLEVLDWGGTGRPVVLLAGAGNTAHVFDDFAPKASAWCHVYGITRRGFGASSRPDSGYDDQRLADDVLEVLNTLKIEGPVLVGHSMAGGEMTTLGNEHSDRLAGLVYLDALGDPRDWPAKDPGYMALARKLPAAMRTPPAKQFTFPESEVRATHGTNSDGTIGKSTASAAVWNAIGEGQTKRDYSKIRVPVLAFFEFVRFPGGPPQPGDYQPKNDDERAAIEAFNKANAVYVARWIANLKSGVPGARLVDLPGAGHYVFLTRETEVLNGLHDFVAGLP